MKGVLEAAGDERLSAEDAEKYDRIEQDFDATTREIERLEKVEGIAPTMDRSVVDTDPEKIERGDGEVAELRDRAKRGDKKARVEYAATDEYRDAFEALIRARGYQQELGAEHRVALAVGTDAQGGYLVPDEFYRQIVEKAFEASNVRPYATVVATGDHGDLLIPKEDGDVAVTWLAEGAAYTQTEPTFGQTSLKAYKAGTISKVSDEMIQDPIFDILGYLANRLGRAFAKETNKQYVAGASGSTTTPEGFINKATVGKTAASNAAVTADELIDLYHSVADQYRADSRWYLRDATLASVRKLKDTTNQYLWQPGLQAGAPDVLLGKPVSITPDVPAIATTARSVAFGDLKGYWIRDVKTFSIKVLNELYAANGQVGVRADLRTDGDLVDTDAIKVLAHPV